MWPNVSATRDELMSQIRSGALLGMGITLSESHGNGNKTWAWKWRRMETDCMGGNGNVMGMLSLPWSNKGKVNSGKATQ